MKKIEGKFKYFIPENDKNGGWHLEELVLKVFYLWVKKENN
jgi:hypothetical protein